MIYTMKKKAGKKKCKCRTMQYGNGAINDIIDHDLGLRTHIINTSLNKLNKVKIPSLNDLVKF
jgi:hypothetical protein